MKLNSEPAYTVQDNTQNQARKKVEIHNTGHAMRIFAESTYTRPIEAVVRETIANAMDTSQGKDFDVTTPSLLDPNFKVRDYGRGMDEAFFLDGYAKVGFSTKRDSNTEIGGFGQGRFAAFAYKPCDQFYVKGIKDGKFFLGSVWHDADFEVYVQVERRGDTDEPNGVEVIIPVLVADHAAFRDSIRIFTEFVPTAQTGLDPLIRPALFTGKDKSWKITSFDRYADEAKGVLGEPCRAVMGGVPYKLDFTKVWNTYSQSEWLNIYMGDFIFDIGTLSIPASREELRYDEVTKAAIKAKLKAVKEEIIAEVAERQKALKTDFERWTDPNIGAYEKALGNTLRKQIDVRNGKVTGMEFVQNFDKIREFEGRSRTSLNYFNFEPGHHYLVYVIDTPLWRKRYGAHASKAIADLDAAHAAANPQTSRKASGTVIVLNSDAAIATSFGNVPYIKTSTIPEPPKVPRVKVVLPPGATPFAPVARTPKTATWDNRQMNWVMADADFSKPGVVYFPLKITQLKEDYTKLFEHVRSTTAMAAIRGVPDADLKLAQAASWIDAKDWVKSLFTTDVLEGLAYVHAWPNLMGYGERTVREPLLELLSLVQDGYKLPQPHAVMQKKLEIVGQALSIKDDDIRSSFGSMLSFYPDLKIPDHKDPKYQVRKDFINFMDDKKVFATLLREGTFTALRKASVDKLAILSLARKAI